MPIITQLSPFPTAPNSTQTPEVFNENADNFVAHYPTHEAEINQITSEINTTGDDINNVANDTLGYKNEASSSATQAKSSETESEDSAVRSEASAVRAEAVVIPTEAVDSQIVRDGKDEVINSSNLPFSGLVTTDATQEIDLIFNDDGLVIPINNQYVKIDGQVEDISGSTLDFTNDVPETYVETTTTTSQDVASGDYVVVDEELIQDGSFDSAGIWIQGAGWTIAAGVATSDGTTSASSLYEPTPSVNGKEYIITFDVTAYTSGTVRARVGNIRSYDISSIGNYSIILVSDGNSVLGVESNLAFNGSVDNISVKLKDDIYRNETANTLLAGSDVLTTMTARPYISNQIMAGVNKDTNEVITTKNHIMFDDFVDGRTELEHMLLNGFSATATVGEYTKGTDTFIPLGYWQTLNKGAYYPTLNPFGTRLWQNESGAGNRLWTHGDVVGIASVAQCMVPSTPGVVSPYDLSGDLGGSTVRARPDAKLYDVVYENQLIPMYTNAREFSDGEIADAKRKKYINGTAKGILSQSVGTSLKVEDQTDTAKTVWDIVEKANQVYEVLSTPDSGVTWVVESFTFDTILNQVTISSQTEVKISYEMINPMMQTTTPLPITYTTEKSLNTSSHNIDKGAGITNLFGGIATGNGAITLESDYLRNVEIWYDEAIYIGKVINLPNGLVVLIDADDFTYAEKGEYYKRVGASAGVVTVGDYNFQNTADWEVLTGLLTPKNSVSTLTADTSKASKSFYNVVVKDGVLSDSLIVDETVENLGVYDGDNGEYNQLTNGTYLDTNGNTAQTGVFINQLSPFRRKG